MDKTEYTQKDAYFDFLEYQSKKAQEENKKNEIDNYNNSVHDNEQGDKVNRNFAQLYDNTSPYIMQLIAINPLSAQIFIFFINNMYENNTIIVENKTMQEYFNKSASTVKRAISTLKEYNIVYIDKINKVNVYFINPRLACRCKAEFKLKLLEEYNKRTQLPNTQNVDENIIKSDAYNKEDKLTLRIQFNKKNKELLDIDYCMNINNSIQKPLTQAEEDLIIQECLEELESPL
ncbi:MAG: replication/maintenance protein RepL [Lachnospiraceae bacterium]|nr:replication/maintenance protein RepL [Lachnospiraceae bacterium]